MDFNWNNYIKKKDWIKLFNYIGFKGDYYFSESKKLKL